MSEHVPDQRPADMTRVAADDRVLDALAAGGRPDDDELVAALADLRGALDAAYVDAALPDVIPALPPRRRLIHRGGFVAVAAITAAVSITGVAAAVGGNANPLHRVVTDIVGAPHLPDPYAVRAGHLLDQAAAVLATGRARGWVTPDERERSDDLLGRAASDVRRCRDADERARAQQRLDSLRTGFAALTVRGADSGPSESAEPGDDHQGAAAPTAEPGDGRSQPATAGPSESSGSDGEHSAAPDPTATPKPTSTSGDPTPEPRETSGGSDSGSDSGSDGR